MLNELHRYTTHNELIPFDGQIDFPPGHCPTVAKLDALAPPQVTLVRQAARACESFNSEDRKGKYQLNSQETGLSTVHMTSDNGGRTPRAAAPLELHRRAG